MTRQRYYMLLGRLVVPCDEQTWARLFCAEEAWRVHRTDVGPLWVSTVFLGLDHRWTEEDGEGLPIVFETMIFGLEHDDYQERCCTWDEAEAMHARAVAVAEEWVSRAKAATDGLAGNPGGRA